MSVVLTVCIIAHEHSLGFYSYISFGFLFSFMSVSFHFSHADKI